MSVASTLPEHPAIAHLETEQTSGQLVTYTRGRSFRFASRPRHVAARVASKERRRICILSARSGDNLRDYGISEPCHGPSCHHAHYTREAATGLVTSGVLRWIGAGKNVAAYTQGREWVKARSGPVFTMQLTERRGKRRATLPQDALPELS